MTNECKNMRLDAKITEAFVKQYEFIFKRRKTMNVIKKVARLIKLYTTGIGPMPVRGLISKELKPQPGCKRTIGYFDKKGNFIFASSKF